MRIKDFDHLVLNVADVERSLAFYVGPLGLEPVNVEEWRAGKVSFPSVRVSPTMIIDLLAAPRSEANVDHFCLVVDPLDWQTVIDGGTLSVVDGPGPRSGHAARPSRSTCGTPTTTPSSSAGTRRTRAGTNRRSSPPDPSDDRRQGRWPSPLPRPSRAARRCRRRRGGAARWPTLRRRGARDPGRCRWWRRPRPIPCRARRRACAG